MVERRFTETQFTILKEIANKKQSATDIARKTDISLPYILSQLVLLEARDIIKKVVVKKEKTPGKPKKYYEISQSLITLTILRDGFGKHTGFVDVEEPIQDYFQIFSNIPTKGQYIFSVFYWTNIKHHGKIKAIGFLKSTESKVEIVALTDNKNLEELRKGISSQTIKDSQGKDVNFACWVHTKEEFIHGCQHKDAYYENLMKTIKPIFDPEKRFDAIRKKVEK